MPGGGERLSEVLRTLAGCGLDLDADQILDVLWLARRLPSDADAPLLRQTSTQPSTSQSPPPDGQEPQERPTPSQPAPQHDDPELPDLTSPSLYSSARRAPVPEPRAADPDREPRRALPVRVPEDKALVGELELGRALRPLRRRHDSRHRTEIDEDRTASALAETHLPDVVERPVRERWLDLTLLVDDGLSMLLWHRLGTELRALLERLGAFAVTRVLGLDTRSPQRPRLHARPFSPGSTELPLSTVNDPSGRTLLLVVSDGMGPAWRSGAMHRLLAERAARGPVAVLHTLPRDMWEASGISATPWQATTRRIGGANTSWRITDPVLPAELGSFDDIPVPVLQPTAQSLRVWARLLASPGITVELPLLVRPDNYATVAAARDLSSVQHFRDAATPEAYRLAAHLAAVAPLSVPVMRLVQRGVPWTATTSHLAEVFLGGLLRPHPAPVPGPLPAKHRVFDFSDDSKTVLLDAVPQAELLRTGGRIARRLEELAGNSPDFPAWLLHPDGSDVLSAAQLPFSSIERRLLTRFGVSFGDTRRATGPARQDAMDTDDWDPLVDEDPRRVGGYELRGRRRGRRTVVYRGVDADGREAVVRLPRPDLPAVNAGLIAVEAEVLARLQGQYAPLLLDAGLDESPPWLAMTPISDTGAPDAQPTRLLEIFTRALTDSTAPFDLLQGLLVSCYLANAVALCHVNGIVPAFLDADSVYVLRRTVVLGDLSDCAVDGTYLGSGVAPTREDNVRALGELLQVISSKAGWEMPGLPEGMHLWQGDTWEQLRKLVLRCGDPEPERRPSASEVAEILARYVSRTRLQLGGARSSAVQETRPRSVPLTQPPPEITGATPPELRLPRFGAARREAERRLERLRVPLSHSRRLTLVGAHHYSGRATTTMVLGSVLAAVRGEPVLALDGSASEGALDAFLTDRNPAVVRDLAALPDPSSYETIRDRTTRLPSGLEVAAHRAGHFTPNPSHQQEYAQVLVRTAPYYSFVLTDWAPLHLDGTAEAVLDHTDRLILCCGTGELSLDAAVRTLARLRGNGREQLARRALVVATDMDVGSGRELPEGFTRRLQVPAGHVVQVGFDAALQSPGWTLDRLRPATTATFLRLAELALRDDGDRTPR
ncbi:SAV_2336 N-terminal domain-related protein [Streptomyces sp. LaPpAH-108]|uniref:SAV_2336 N-terminal domain-related protein n=1 Tax=Streptomyces sp. LaPpAH-108 TaxID=1155714 RepID=UPI0003A3140A|nr:SAV_2336 N-terminal domain-related protein [Streptomyces sp. LaPpAH-108]